MAYGKSVLIRFITLFSLVCLNAIACVKASDLPFGFNQLSKLANEAI
jgi:hypothetical protein